MDEFSHQPIYRHTFEMSALMADYPPKLYNANKKIVLSIACPPGTIYRGRLVCSRWLAMPLLETFDAVAHRTELDEREEYFGYEPASDRDRMEWYLNFAHSDLFCAYGGRLLAQDELQVAEHPALSSLREALIATGIQPLTVENGAPTPILIRGVERRCKIAIDPNPVQGRPDGLYGNNFARATPEAIERATQPLDPPTITNIIAIEAPVGGYGAYTLEEIEYILITAFTGFTAARLESQLAEAEQPQTIVHTGFWGCGAYGGNRVLMALLQILAARLSRVTRLVFHTGGANGGRDLATASQIIDRLLGAEDVSIKVSDLVLEIYRMKFRWGISDGN